MMRLPFGSKTPSRLSTSRWAVAALTVLSLTWLAAPAWAKDAPAAAAPPAATAINDRCLGCHDDATMKADDGRSLAVLAADFNRSAHRKLDCAVCHEDAQTLKHPSNPLGAVKPKVCQDCHSDAFKAIAGSIHGRGATGDKAIKACINCHDSLHRVRVGGDPASSLSPVNQIKTCGACHEEMMANYERSEHARALLKSGLAVGAPSCASCHGKHDIHPKTEVAATTSQGKIPDTCGRCHTGILLEWLESAHGTMWKNNDNGAKSSGGPVCSTCHEPHAIKRPDSAVVRKQVSDRCGNCHTGVYESYHDSFHGQASSLRNAKAAVCSDCHTPHHNLPASDPRSSVNPANLAKTCGVCHDNPNASFLSFDPHADPKDPKRNAYLHWVWLSMTGLLLSTFAFFGLHDLLWLQRAVVGKLRGEFGTAHGKKSGPYVRRFSVAQIALHVTIVTSFLLLAATGLPLKFAQSTWAPKLISVFGSAEWAGVLHRLAAVVTFCYFAWHIGTLVYGWIVKKERGYFWGEHSMTPQPRDLMDFTAMVKYFLYIGPRPKFGRFTYWEKFDYLAVFWGVAVIGLSGLVLWMPTLAAKVLPGWALNAAFVVHSDEALLATGFIFMFHFFHTHLRPESFPMDTVVFTGRMPLATFQEERPLEYASLVAQGRLEEKTGPAPTAGQFRLAYFFGFAALAIGIILAAFIFLGLLGGFGH